MKKTYRIYVHCPALGRDRSYPIRARSKNAAWRIALRRFFSRFPAVLERGLAVGGGVERTFRMYVFCPALSRSRSYPISALSEDAAWHVALIKFFNRFPVAFDRRLTVDGGWHLEKTR